MLTRIISSILLLPSIIIILFFLSEIQFMLFIAIISIIISWEWHSIFKFSTNIKIFLVLFFSFLFFFFIFFSINNKHESFYIFNLIILISIFWWITSIFFIKFYPKYNFLWINNSVLCTIFNSLIIVPFFCAILLLIKYHNYYIKNSNGYFLVLYVFLLVCSFDSGSYFFGYFLGKKRIIPKISPGKTWIGLFGGILSAFTVNFLLFTFNIKILGQFTSIFSFIFILLGSFLGDLTESMFKRSINIKNSGNLIPGHGGILDRTDSLVSSFPMFVFILFISYLYQNI